MNNLKIGIIGLGYWGKKYIQTLRELGVTSLFGTDIAPAGNFSIPELLFIDLDDLLINKEVQVVIIATPEQTHYQLCREALNFGKDVLLEKPMAHSSREAHELFDLAMTKCRILGVAHIPLYTDSFRQLAAEINSGKMGKISRIEAIRTSRGREKSAGVLWDLAGHDLAIAISLFGNPIDINYCVYQHHTCYYQIEFPDKLRFSGIVSWADPPFYRLLKVYSSTGVFEYQEPNGSEPIAWLPNYEKPLTTMVKEFINCCITRQQPKNNGELGCKVVRFLESLSQKMFVNYETIGNHSSL